MPKTIMKVEGKNISKRKMKIIWGFIFSLSKRNIHVEGRKIIIGDYFFG